MFLLIFPNIFIFNISIIKKKRTFGNMKCNFAHVSFLIDNVFDKFSWNKINLIRKIKCFSRRMRKIWSFAFFPSFWNFTLNIKYFTLICYISFSGLINKKKKSVNIQYTFQNFDTIISFVVIARNLVIYSFFLLIPLYHFHETSRHETIAMRESKWRCRQRDVIVDRVASVSSVV